MSTPAKISTGGDTDRLDAKALSRAELSVGTTALCFLGNRVSNSVGHAWTGPAGAGLFAQVTDGSNQQRTAGTGSNPAVPTISSQAL
jgi:hypothetical protein